MRHLAVLLILVGTASRGDERRDLAQVRALVRALDAAAVHMSNEETLALWTDDGVSILPGQAPLQGKKAIAAFLAQITARYVGFHVKSIETTLERIEILGDHAVAWGSTEQIGVTPTGKELEARGNILLVFRRTRGRWLITREMWNER